MNVYVDVERWLPRPGDLPAVRDMSLAIGELGVEAVPLVRSGGRGRLALPAPVNAHDHGYGVRPFGFGAFDDALEPWIPGLGQRPRTDPYREAVVAFGRLALGGVGATMHCHNSLRAGRLVEEAQAVARAARDVGIRLALSCPLLDANPWVYGGIEALRPHLSAEEWEVLEPLVPTYAGPEDQIAAVDAVAAACAGGVVDVQYGPIGPQWCSDRLLTAIADASARTGRRIHMHLLESPRQRRWLDRRYPQGIVPFLDSIGFLSPRLAIAHGVQLRPDECELLAERGVQVVSNPTANLRLRSGIAPVAQFRRAGLGFAFGLDGTGLDDDQDLWRELRLAFLLHGGRGLDPSLPAAELFGAALDVGARVVNQPARRDVAILDWAGLTADALFDDLDETTVLLGRMTRSYVEGLVVDGRWVVRDRHLAGVDFAAAEAELLAEARAGTAALLVARERARTLARVTRRFYAEWA